MKKALSIILVIVFLFSCVPINAFAQESAVPTEDLSGVDCATITVESTYADIGNTVEVNIAISNNPGIAGATLSIGYHNNLTLISAESGEAFSSLDFSGNDVDIFTNPSKFSWDSENTVATENGNILKLTFRVLEQATLNSQLGISVSYRFGDVYNDENDISLEFIDGYVTVIDYMPGDLFEDDIINTKDVRLIRQLINGNCTVEVNEAAADVNADGVINTKDTRLLRRFINGGYGVTLLPALIQCPHTDLTAVVAKEATCTENGNTAYWTCSACGKYFSDAEGKAEISLHDTIIPATGHTEIVDEAVDATYDKTGLTEGLHCSVCNAVLIAQQQTPMLDASYHSITYRNLKTAEYPSQTSYAEHSGLLELPTPSVSGYKFVGWYTASVGGELVDYIPAGDTTDYILFAHWELETYTITYENAPINSNTIEYNIETATFKLTDPVWSGLSFAYWADEEGNVITQINQGTTGNITLTAHWKYYENLAIPSTNDSMVSSIYDETLGMYHFIFKAGVIDNVVLEEYESFDKKVGESLSWSKTEEFSVENSIASNVANTVSQNISTSNEWSQTSEWAQSHSESENWSLSAGLGLDFGKIKGSIEASEGGSTTDENSWTNSTVTGTSGSVGSELESSFSSTVSWASSSSISMTRTLNLSEDMAAGTYTLACVGKVAVYVIVSYNPEEQSYHLDTYSVLENNFRTATLYTLPSDSKVSIVENEPLSYSISVDKLQTYVNSSWYEVQYDANGGDGEMPTTIFYSGINQLLYPNCFTKEGYTFSGWKYQNDTSVIIYQDEQSVCDLASAGETVVLQAIWTANQYTVTLDVAGGNTLSPSTHSVTYNEKYGKSGTLPTPTRTGYTFDGWYNGNNLVSDDSIVITASNHMLTAKWTPQIYTITFNGNGGTANLLTKDVSYASTYGELPSATREGYTFDGWFTESTDGTQITSDTATVIDGEPSIVTLYAHWTPIEYTVHFSDYDNGRTVTLKYDQSYTLDWYEFTLWDTSAIGMRGWYRSNSNGDLLELITSSSKITVYNYTSTAGEHVYIQADVYQKDNSCFTGDTLITLADGSSTTLESLEAGDIIMSWNAITGEFEAMPISLFWNHGEAVYDIISLTFSNGKTLKVVTEHGFFDATLNKYVYIDAFNYNDYIGHEFACLNENGVFENVTLIAANYKKEMSSCYSLRTACNDNAIVDGFLTLTHEDIPGFLTYFEFGDGYMYDEVKMQEDIEKYGLYTYDDWKEYVSYEEFVALNGQYLTIAIGKGYLTYEDVLSLIAGMR